MLKAGLRNVIRHPTIHEDDEEFTTQDVKKIIDAPQILEVIQSHCSFFNFKLLRKLNHSWPDTKQGITMMEEYEKGF